MSSISEIPRNSAAAASKIFKYKIFLDVKCLVFPKFRRIPQSARRPRKKYIDKSYFEMLNVEYFRNCAEFRGERGGSGKSF